MNIFPLSLDHDETARWMVDSHVVKMILEYAQLLSTAHHLCGGNQAAYRPTHQNHPSARWTRLSGANYLWLRDKWLALHREYQYRYGRDHKSVVELYDVLNVVPSGLPISHLSPVLLAMPDEYKLGSDTWGDVILSYRNYYRLAKKDLHSWTKRPPPDWI